MRDHRTAILWLGRYHRVFLISFRAVSIRGQASAANLDYAPLPKNVVAMLDKRLSTVKTVASK